MISLAPAPLLLRLAATAAAAEHAVVVFSIFFCFGRLFFIFFVRFQLPHRFPVYLELLMR